MENSRFGNLSPRPRFGAGHAPIAPQDHRDPPALDISDQRRAMSNLDPAAIGALADSAMQNFADVTDHGAFGTMPEAMLAKYRHGHPFTPIWPMPQAVVSVTLAPNVVQDVAFPDEALWFYCSSSGPAAGGAPLTYYLGLSGITSTLAAGNGYTMPFAGVSPAFYCYGRRSVSIAADVACMVGFAFFMQDVSAGRRDLRPGK